MDAVQTVKHTLSGNVSLDFDSEDHSYCLQADPPYIRQALLSLLLNAVEAVAEKGGHIQVNLKKIMVKPDHSQRNAASKTLLKSGPHLALSITDDGPGIEPENMHKIFDPFFSTKFTGRGLGLAATCGIMKDHQGDIEVSSRAGKGTTVTLCLPLIPEREV